MDRILFRDVRCFRGEHDIPFAPLTFLVGENSTGKSTILAMTRVAWDVGHGYEEPDFNEEPFQLGAFGGVMHSEAEVPEAGFSVGFTRIASSYGRLDSDSSDFGASYVGNFANLAGQPSLAEFVAFDTRRFAKVFATEGRICWQLHDRAGEVPVGYSLNRPMTLRSVQNQLSREQYARFGREEPLPDHLSFEEFGILLKELRLEDSHQMIVSEGRRIVYPRPRPLALAPVRTRPRRTYDPLRETQSPEGDHVPMLLARLRATDPKTWEALAADLADYGRGSGLFSDLLVHRFNDGEASPFQVQVRLSGQTKSVNLVDVGYGVSQVLPILVDAFTQPEDSSFLLQQPEVHLHPKAQAELGSMLVSLVKRRRHKFMIETHSDHLVDRVRLEVKRGKIPAEDVRIVYCERADSHVLTHEIKVDANGNLIGAPEGYRQFFLDEELALLGG